MLRILKEKDDLIESWQTEKEELTKKISNFYY